ncbi:MULTISPECIES: DNA/RNA non-specific endonuclease [Pseudomonas]|uniref:DNA/RNA non-specific endonuclease n=1 Tax=Pseudomonas TaxID=286 RepID=UPI00235DDFEA|nr:DNA/RNA non-specific endonuclease [Pseudomonas asplenii]
MTGTLYERYIDTLPSTTKQHPIPSGYWKIIFTTSTPTEGTFAAFIMDQDTPRAASFCSYQVTVEEIEQRSGLKSGRHCRRPSRRRSNLFVDSW